MPRRLFGLLALTLAVLSPVVPAAPQNDERILRFHCEATVQADGTLRVEETIRVRARGIEIRRGIYRDFPTKYRDKDGRPIQVGFEIEEVRRDGEPENYRTEPRDNGVRVYIGSPDYYLPDGEYTYTLVYRTTRQLGFFEDHDELYWNVTGNGWVFRIDSATATVRLPAGVPRDRIRLEGYTGPQGATGRDYAAEVDADGAAQFRSTATLGPRQGLTIVVGWPKGFVTKLPPLEDERILQFHSEITVNADATADVRETIRVRARGQNIRHGIDRDFSTVHGSLLLRRSVGVELLEVQRDGKPEDYRTDKLHNNVRVSIGRADFLLPPGEYTYTLVYRTTRQLVFFDDHDELNWNVTGNDWALPLDEAVATVRLPGGVPREKIRVEGYTGPTGVRYKNFIAEVDSGSAEFRTTAGLDSGDGLTVVVGWPKGFVEEPPATAKLTQGLRDNPELLIGFGGLALVFLYYLLAWIRVGRDPARGTIVTLYEPPEGYSPAAIRYLTRESYDDKVFTASVLNMAIKGYLTIRKTAGVHTLARGDAEPGVLHPEEQKIGEALFASGPQLELKQENHLAVSSAVGALETFLKTRFKTDYFRANLRYTIPGLLVSAAAVIAMIGASTGSSMFDPFAVLIGAFVTFWSLLEVVLARVALAAWKRVAGGGSLVHFLVAAFFSVFLVTTAGFWVIGLVLLGLMTSLQVFVFLIALLGVNLLFLYLLKAPTQAARALLDKVEGFKEFLTAVEGDRLQRMSVPEITAGLFERLLPYAVALNLEQAWTKKFERALAAAGQAPMGTDGGYSPDWYSGESWSSLGASGFASSIESSLSSSISSASIAPGSSSGFSGGDSDFGGGSSGGGGGGGSGGGW